MGGVFKQETDNLKEQFILSGNSTFHLGQAVTATAFYNVSPCKKNGSENKWEDNGENSGM